MRTQAIAKSHLRHPALDVNPFTLVGIFILIPYLLFYILLCVATGSQDPWLLLHALRDLGQSLYFRAWLTGSMLLCLLAAWWFGTQRVRTLIRHTHHLCDAPNDVEAGEYYSIEIAVDPTPGQHERYGRLALALDASDR